MSDSFMRYINAVADGDDIGHQIACGNFDPSDFPTESAYDEEREREDMEKLLRAIDAYWNSPEGKAMRKRIEDEYPNIPEEAQF